MVFGLDAVGVRAPLLSDASGPGRSAAFLVLLGFVLAFLFIRTSARMIRAEVSWWPGNVETDSGLHLHHLVWGIGLMLIGGLLGFAFAGGSPWYQIAAVAFGIGAGLTLDEFALWVHLKDVYWSDQGRSSLDAVVLTVAFMGMVVIGVKPFGLGGASTDALAVFAVAQALVLSVISFLKGRIGLGVIAIFVPLFGLWATFRLAKPASPWARRFYDEHKAQRARERFPPDRRGARFRAAFFDAIGGKPSEPTPPPATDRPA
jgi:hypothetical protein